MNLLTAEEYARLPEADGIDELRAGFLIAEPRPLPRHGRVQLELAARLHDHCRRLGLGVVLTDAGFLLAVNPDTVRGPDVAFVRRERYDPAEEGKGFFRGAPDLAAEIVSPSNHREEIRAKVADFFAAGTKAVWVIDPDRRCADVYRAPSVPRRVLADGFLDGEDVVPEFAVRISELLDL